MTIVLDGTNGISTPDLESAGPVTGTTATFSGPVTLGSSVLATPTGSAPSYTCRAWVNFNGTGTVAIRASGNVSSIADNGVGDYTVNFTTAMPDANYCPSVSMAPSYGAGNAAATNMFSAGLSEQAPTASAFRFSCSPEAGGYFDPKYMNVSIFR